MDRVMCIEIVKNIQSMALSVQKYLEQTSLEPSYCKRCSKNEKFRKKFGLHKVRESHKRPKNISSFLWAKNSTSNYDKLEETDVSRDDDVHRSFPHRSSADVPTSADGSASKDDEASSDRPWPDIFQASGSTNRSDLGLRVRRNPIASSFFESAAKRRRMEEELLDREETMREEEESRGLDDSATVVVKSEPQDLSTVPEVAPDERPSSPTRSTFASDVLKSLASKTFQPASGAATTVAGDAPLMESYVASGSLVGRDNAAYEEDNFSGPAEESVSAPSQSPRETPNAAQSNPPKSSSFASEILKSLASKSKLHHNAAVTSDASGEETASDRGDDHESLAPPLTTKHRPSTDILRNLLESIPVESLDTTDDLHRHFIDDRRCNPHEESSDVKPQISRPTPTLPGGSGTIPAIFGGNAAAKSIFTFSSSNPFTSVDFEALAGASSNASATFASSSFWTSGNPFVNSGGGGVVDAHVTHAHSSIPSATSILSQLAQNERTTSVADSAEGGLEERHHHHRDPHLGSRRTSGTSDGVMHDPDSNSPNSQKPE